MWWVMLFGSAVLFLLMMGLFALSWLRPGWSRKIGAQRLVVLGGLGLPALVLIPLVAYALVTGERLMPLPSSSPPRIEVQAERWAWRFNYPAHAGATTTGVLHLPAGEPVDLVIGSSDLIHSFWIPRLGGKMDAIPGRINVLRLQADLPGDYEGQCAEFCGIGHTSMKFKVIVHPAAEYAAALAAASSIAGTKP
jgi:cytochrome c oxidase subunit 2